MYFSCHDNSHNGLNVGKWAKILSTLYNFLSDTASTVSNVESKSDTDRNLFIGSLEITVILITTDLCCRKLYLPSKLKVEVFLYFYLYRQLDLQYLVSDSAEIPWHSGLNGR